MGFVCGLHACAGCSQVPERTLDIFQLSCWKLWAFLSRCWELKYSPQQVEFLPFTTDPSLKYQ